MDTIDILKLLKAKPENEYISEPDSLTEHCQHVKRNIIRQILHGSRRLDCADFEEVVTDNEHYFEERMDGYMRKVGLYKCWYNNGQPRQECMYEKGRLAGSYKSWYSNGVMKERGNVLDAEPFGEYKTWYSNGIVDQHCFYIEQGKDITTDISAIVKDLSNITSEEKLIIAIRFGIPVFGSRAACL